MQVPHTKILSVEMPTTVRRSECPAAEFVPSSLFVPFETGVCLARLFQSFAIPTLPETLIYLRRKFPVLRKRNQQRLTAQLLVLGLFGVTSLSALSGRRVSAV